MSYIGNPPAERFTSFDYQDLTGGSGTSFTLTHPVGNAQEILVMVNNVVQEPGVAYTVSGTALTMTGSIVSADDFYVVYRGKAIQTATHPSDRALTATDGTFTGDLTVDTNTLFVDSTNNEVGIGTTSPTKKLSASIGLNDTDGLALEYSGENKGGILLNPIGGEVRMGALNSTGTYFTSIYANGSERLRVLSGGGLTFNGDTAAANALNDYEEGTWTPSLTGFTTSGTVTKSGTYTKIGRTVILKGQFEATTSIAGATGGTNYVSNLPFTPESGTTGYTTATWSDLSSQTSLGNNIFAYGNIYPPTFSFGANRAAVFSVVYQTSA